jgi:hypothetical protein
MKARPHGCGMLSLFWNVRVPLEDQVFRPSGAGWICCFRPSHGLRRGLLSFAPVGGLMGATSSPLGFLVWLPPPLFCVLLTGPCLPSSPGPEGRKKIAHGVNCGNRTEVESPEPRRGERHGQYLCLPVAVHGFHISNRMAAWCARPGGPEENSPRRKPWDSSRSRIL